MSGLDHRAPREVAAALDPGENDGKRRWVRALRHPLRLCAMVLAALALSWGLSSGAALLAAAAGAALGVVGGELVGRSRLRTAVALALAAGLLAVGLGAAELAVSTRALARGLGPAFALEFAASLRHFIAVGVVVATLRLLASRRPALHGLELAAVIAALASMFAAHRHGVVARPLWLSDWAWQHGYDPSQLFLVIGGAAVVLVAFVMLAESRARVTVVTLASLPLLALLALAFVGVQGLPRPTAVNQLGLTEHELGEPPNEDPDDDEGDEGSAGAKSPDRAGGGGGRGGARDPARSGGGGGRPGERGEGRGSANGDPDGPGDPGERGDGSGTRPGQPGHQGQGGRPPQRQSSVEDQDPSSGNAPAPMAVVLLGDDYAPATEAFYFRQDVWSHFNGSRLVATTRGEVDLDIVRSFPAREVNAREEPPAEGHARIHQTVALLVEHTAPFGLESPVLMAPEPNPNPSRFIRAYRVESLAPDYELAKLIGHSAGNPAWSETARAAYLAGPEDPRYRELAESIVATMPADKAGDPFLRALTIKLWMDEHLTYSTAEKHAGVADPTADFLFGNRIGYCVHFAHAAVYMWRALGIPARVGTGYHVEEESRKGSTLLIRGGDAHAWPELYLEGIGWVILDISAQANLDPPGTPVDTDLAELLGEMARKPPDARGADPARAAERGGFGRELALAGAWLGLLLFAALHLVKLVRRLAPRWSTPATAPRLYFRLVLDLLGEAGEQRAHGETREAFARRLADRVPALAELTAMHVSARLGDPRTRGARAEHRPELWRAGVDALRADLRRAIPTWRRILGRLDPTSFLRTH